MTGFGGVTSHNDLEHGEAGTQMIVDKARPCQIEKSYVVLPNCHRADGEDLKA